MLQLVKFLALSLIATAVELLSFAFFNSFVFLSLRSRSFSWFVFSYPESVGGLCSFLSMGLSFTLAQVVNFFVQRKYTFKSSGRALRSAFFYAVMVLVCYFAVLYIPTVIGSFFYGIFGYEMGSVIVKMLCQSSSALIQFPINKFLIMK